MNINVGDVDRILRVVLGIVLMSLAAAGVIGWWGWLGVIPLGTGLLSFCPLYALLGIHTCRLSRKGDASPDAQDDADA